MNTTIEKGSSVVKVKSKYVLNSSKQVKFVFREKVIKDVHSIFFKKRFLFDLNTDEDTGEHVLTLSEKGNKEGMKFLWVLNGLKESWVKTCPYNYFKGVENLIEECEIKKDVLLLKGFFYKGKFDSSKKRNFDGPGMREVCRIMHWPCRREMANAAELMYNRHSGHVNTVDPCIVNYVDDKYHYDILIGLEILCKDTDEVGNVFLRMPSIKASENELGRCFDLLRNRFSDEDEISNEESSRSELSEVLCEEQLRAVEVSMAEPVSYVTGSAGRGKTSVITEIIRQSTCTVVCTPTHAARKVVEKRINKNGMDDYCRVEVNAFVNYHAYKYFDDNFDHVATDRVCNFFEGEHPDTLIIEEASMVCVSGISKLISNMLSVFETIVRVVFVGDTNQLRSIGKGNVLDDIINSESIVGTKLTINHRSGLLSENIDCILEGNFKGIKTDDSFEVVYVDEVERHDKKTYVTREIVNQLVKLEKMGHQAHALCYLHKELERVNSVMQEKRKPFLKVRVKKADLLKSDHKFYTNDILEIISCYQEGGNMLNVKVREWKRVSSEKEFPTIHLEIKQDNLDNAWELAFSTTIHTFQGDEADAIVISSVDNCKFLDRNALYTACSRAKKKIVLVTTKGSNSYSSIVGRLNPGRSSFLTQVLDKKVVSIYMV